jgi:gamma-glutamyltranspeptidase/glutathione hydrolase
MAACTSLNRGYTPGFRGGMVASADSLATEAGLQILKEGGNAVDAAVAVGFALAVTHPAAGNIGGGGFALIYGADSDTVFALDFREEAPEAANRNMYLDDSGEVVQGLSTNGFKAAGTPGTVAGLLEMLDKYGSLPRNKVIQPAIVLARDGFAVDSTLSGQFSRYQDNFEQYESTRKYFLRGGETPKPGDTLIQSDLAHVLELIAEMGSAGFYQGEVASRVAEQMKKNGGLITLNDLADYRPVWRNPVHIDLAQLRIYSMSPPSSGGVVMGEIIGMLSNFQIAGRKPTDPEYIHLFIESSRLAYADRASYLGDPDIWYNPTELLLSPEYLYSRSQEIDTTRATPSIRVRPGLDVRKSENTTHFCVADSLGNAVSLTYTINSEFGCKEVVDGLGFFMNNEMDDFSIKSGVPNQFGLVGGEANAIAPRKRMLSSMSPTIVFYEDKPMMLVGTPGGSKIITAVTSTIMNYFGFGMSLDSAINVPHYHHQWLPDLVYYESGAFNSQQIAALESMGHHLKERSDWGDLQAIVIQPDGSFIGASDHRGDGYAGGF